MGHKRQADKSFICNGSCFPICMFIFRTYVCFSQGTADLPQNHAGEQEGIHNTRCPPALDKFRLCIFKGEAKEILVLHIIP